MIVILGAGAMGAALAAQCARAGRDVSLLATSFDAAAAAAIRAGEAHPGLGLVLPGHLRVVDPQDWSEPLRAAKIVALAVSTAGLAPVIADIAHLVSADAIWCVATKGIEESTLRSAHGVVCDAVGDPSRVVALVGPSLAAEIAAGVPTGLVAACDDRASAEIVAAAISGAGFRVDPADDVAGVEVCSALKNVVAIAAGLCEGLASLEPGGEWTNTQAFVFSRGLQEMASLAVALGGRIETVLGLAGAGDLFVTVLGGRNARFGRLIGEGLSPEAALQKMNTTVEGFNNARAAMKLAAAHGLDLPVVTAVGGVLFDGLTPRDAITSLV